MIDTLDFCVSFIGENSGILARMFFGTLKKHCNLDGINLHLIDKDVSDKVWCDVIRHAMQLNRPIHSYILDTGWSPYKGTKDLFSLNESNPPTFNDAAQTAGWVVDNCGTAEWCILSHFDVEWRADIIEWLKERQRGTEAMMVGSHCPIMLLNRKAYYECGVKFQSKEGDVGVELAGAIGASGFRIDDEMERYFHHMGGGGGYHTYEEFQSMRVRTLAIIEKEGL